MIKAIKLIDYFFKFERASFRSSGGRGVDRLLVIGGRDALVKERFRYRESRYRESQVYLLRIKMYTKRLFVRVNHKNESDFSIISFHNNEEKGTCVSKINKKLIISFE